MCGTETGTFRDSRSEMLRPFPACSPVAHMGHIVNNCLLEERMEKGGPGLGGESERMGEIYSAFTESYCVPALG